MNRNTALHQENAPRMTTSDSRSIGVFLLISFALSWLLALPLWLADGLSTPGFAVLALGMMMTPGVAALFTVRFVERPARKLDALGITPLRPVRRLLGYSALGIFIPVALVLIALPVGAWIGVYPADFAEFSAFRHVIESQTATSGTELPIPIEMLIAVQLVSIPVGALLNLVPALGEEIGWRGWLLPKLMPLGVVPALAASGVIWGLWHAPLILLGYNYPNSPGWLGLSTMVGMCILMGAVFGWLRLRSQSVWAPALAHGSFNAAAGSYVLFASAGAYIDTTQATILGWTGWIVPFMLVVTLLATKQFRPASSRLVGVPPKARSSAEADSP
jgi:membrane protease YdiL (CAAX protease family)